jgi:hypothetical protein
MHLNFAKGNKAERCHLRLVSSKFSRSNKNRRQKLRHRTIVKVETPKTFAGAMLGIGSSFVLLGKGIDALTADSTLFFLGLCLVGGSIIVWGIDRTRKGKH